MCAWFIGGKLLRGMLSDACWAPVQYTASCVALVAIKNVFVSLECCFLDTDWMLNKINKLVYSCKIIFKLVYV